jgi:hypothetical protein
LWQRVCAATTRIYNKRMLTEDYLIRRINQAIALLLHAIGLRKNGQLEAALTDIDIALELLLGMRSVLLKDMDDRALLQLLTTRGELDYERLELVARLFKEEAQIYEIEGRPADSYRDTLRALNFSLAVAIRRMPEAEAEQIGDVEELRRWFKDRRLPIDTQAALLDYYQSLLEMDAARLAQARVDPAEIETELKKLVDSLNQYE